MKRKAVIYTFIPGNETRIKLSILVESKPGTNDFIYKGFNKYYPFYDIDIALSFAKKYTDTIEIKKMKTGMEGKNNV